MSKHKDDCQDIYDEFGLNGDFVEFVWAILGAMKRGKSNPDWPPLPIGAFKPRTKRECALAVAIVILRTQPEDFE